MTRNYALILMEIVLFCIVIFLDSIGLLPITQTIYLLPLIWLILTFKKETFKSIGLSKGPFPLWKSLLIGTATGISLELFSAYLTTPLISHFFGTEPMMTDFQPIKGNVSLLLLYVLISWVLAAFGEEICFRGYLMNRLAQLFGERHTSWILSLLLSSILFGWGHTEQGITGWIQEGLSGLYLGILFLASGKNLTIPIISHGVSNTLAFILIYYGNYPGIV